MSQWDWKNYHWYPFEPMMSTPFLLRFFLTFLYYIASILNSLESKWLDQINSRQPILVRIFFIFYFLRNCYKHLSDMKLGRKRYRVGSNDLTCVIFSNRLWILIDWVWPWQKLDQKGWYKPFFANNNWRVDLICGHWNLSQISIG